MSSEAKENRLWEWGSLTIGVLALLACLFFNARWELSGSENSDAAKKCGEDLFKTKPLSVPAADDLGQLRIIGVAPDTVSIGRELCIGVAGVAPSALGADLKAKMLMAAEELRVAKKAYEDAGEGNKEAKKAYEEAGKKYAEAIAGRQAPDTTLSIFLDGEVLPGVKIPVLAIPEAQFLAVPLQVDADSTTEAGRFWRTLLSGTFSGNTLGHKMVSVGVARFSTDADISASERVKFVVFVREAIISGAIALAAFLAFAVFLARNTNLLRDSFETGSPDALSVRLGNLKEKIALFMKSLTDNLDPNKPWMDEAVGAVREAQNLLADVNTQVQTRAPDARPPYSLAKVQIGLWAFLIISGFLYIWLTLGQHQKLLTSGILALMGIQVAATVTSTQINSVYDPSIYKSSNGASSDFWNDIVRDANGVNLGRLQAIAWTLVLMIIFAWDTLWNFTFPDFDTNLLILLGITQGAYLGMKYAALPKQ